MRTTLKRGAGRGAAVDGNANGHAVLPPAALSPMRRYRQPPPPRRRPLRILGRVVLWLVLSLVVIAAGLAGGVALYADEQVAQGFAPTDEALRVAAENLDAVAADKAAIALAIGYDRRLGTEGEVNGARSDTVMLLRADPVTNTLSALSFPRDLVVDIHCPGRAVFRNRINEAYSECGVRGTLETVRKLTGLPVNYLVTVNFRGFKQLVAKLGGVWLDVDRRYFNDNRNVSFRYATIDLKPGYQKLNGSDALDFVRYRHADSDIFRIARQQVFVQAFRQAVTSSFTPQKLPQIIRVLTDNVQVGRGGNEPLDLGLLRSYGYFLYKHPSFVQSKIDLSCYQGDAELYVAQECVDRAVREFSAPDAEAPEKATRAALGLKPKRQPAPAPRETTLLVLNGSGVAGVAANTSYLFAQLGYRTLVPPGGMKANAPTSDYTTSKAYYDAARPRARAAATAVAKLLGGAADVEPLPGPLGALCNDAMVCVVLGSLFGGKLAAAPVDATPERRPPSVYRNASATLPLLRDVRRRVPFPLMVPTVLERTSTPARDAPLRVYSIAGHPTVRLTFSTGASEFWGIQMIRWNGAPAIQHPDRLLTIGGRRYDLHYAGSRLRMVVLREGGASYWVVNTLMNALSNETMIEIAKGLRPLGRQGG